jgi:small multidrug resistance family-3 protein
LPSGKNPEVNPLENVSRTVVLFIATAIAELVGCYLPYLCLRKGGSPWLLVPAAVSLGVFAWLLTLHPTASGRVYAAYGGVYVAMAILWLWVIDAVRPGRWDLVGAAVTLIGMAIIMFAPRNPTERLSATKGASSSKGIHDGRFETTAAAETESTAPG